MCVSVGQSRSVCECMDRVGVCGSVWTEWRVGGQVGGREGWRVGG